MFNKIFSDTFYRQLIFLNQPNKGIKEAKKVIVRGGSVVNQYFPVNWTREFQPGLWTQMSSSTKIFQSTKRANFHQQYGRCQRTFYYQPIFPNQPSKRISTSKKVHRFFLIKNFLVNQRGDFLGLLQADFSFAAFPNQTIEYLPAKTNTDFSSTKIS